MAAIRPSCRLFVLFVCFSGTNQCWGIQSRHFSATDLAIKATQQRWSINFWNAILLNVIFSVCSCHNWCNEIKRRSMMTNQRGDQRRRKFHVYIGTVCLLRIIYNSSNFYRGWHRRKNARGQRCSREDENAQKARKERQKHKEFELCVAQTAKKL